MPKIFRKSTFLATNIQYSTRFSAVKLQQPRLHWVVRCFAHIVLRGRGGSRQPSLVIKMRSLKYTSTPPLNNTISLTNRRILLKLCMWIKLVEFPCANFFENAQKSFLRKLSVNDHIFTRIFISFAFSTANQPLQLADILCVRHILRHQCTH